VPALQPRREKHALLIRVQPDTPRGAEALR
jgi:hypothetical protein